MKYPLGVKYPVIEPDWNPARGWEDAFGPVGRRQPTMTAPHRSRGRRARSQATGSGESARVFGGPLCGCRLQLEFSVHHFIVDGMLEREAELLAEPLDVTVVGKNLGREPVELLVGTYDEEP